MSQAPYDLLLRGGHVIDPATGWDGTADVAIRDRRIAAVAKYLPGESRETIDVHGRIVLPGMIDTHAHVYTYVSGRFGLPADMVGVESGVTTLVDQGGPSCMTFPGFAKFIAEPAVSRVLAFVSAYVVGGLEGHYYPNLYGPDGVDIAATVKTAKANPDLIRGIKAHAELGGVTRWGFEVMKKAAAGGGRLADTPSPLLASNLEGESYMVIRGVTALFAAGVGLAVASGADAQLLNHKDLSLATALIIATAASDHCKAQGYHVSVAVVGREAQIIVKLRGDASPPHSAENSYRRAYTALTYRQPTLNVEKRVRTDPGDQLVHLREVMGAQGGLPIIVGGDTIGAVAVSGSPGGDKDEACAKAGLDKVADQLK